MIRPRWLLLIVPIFAIGLGGLELLCRHVQAAGNELSISPEQPASVDQWWLRDLANGKDVPYSKFKGKTVFLHFWATWCGPCLTEMPTLERMYQKVKDKDVAVIIVANQNPRDLRPYLSHHKFSFPMYTCGVPPELFMWHSLPMTFVVAPDGKVVKQYSDPYPFADDTFVQYLLSLTRKSSRS